MIVIPMAGLSRRFTDAGYALPKHRLPLAGATLFERAVGSFDAYFATDPFLFVVRDVEGAPAFVAETARALGIARFEVAVLDAPTRGQAETVELGLRAIGVPGADELVIFNVDTIRPGLRIARRAGSSGTLEVFRAPGEHWSFVEPQAAASPWVRRCTEKVRIGELCSTGLYRFAHAEDFVRALDDERARPSSPELYVAPLYNHLIARGLRVDWVEVPAADVWLAGVPAEYEATKARLERASPGEARRTAPPAT